MSKRQEIRKKRQQARLRETMFWIGGIALFVVLIAVLLLLPGIQGEKLPDADSFVTPVENPRPQAVDNTTGDPDAPVKVVEFSDYQCSHCQDFALNIEPALVEQYVATGQVHLTYIPFSFFGPESFQAAEANYCAMDQGKFWEYHDIVFSNAASKLKLSNGYLKAYARAINLNGAQFDECLDSNKYTERTEADVETGKEAQIPGTPAFLVNGQLVSQAELISAIEAALATGN